MRRSQGTLIITDPDAPTRECDTITCSHCQCIVPVKPKQDASDAGGFCMQCFKHICGPCADLGKCVPFEKQIELQEKHSRNRAAFIRSVGLK